LSTKVLSLYCVLDEIYSVLCLTCVFSKCLSYLTMLQLHSITSFNSVCASSKIIKIRHELTSE
jgi:hypothetical protein